MSGIARPQRTSRHHLRAIIEGSEHFEAFPDAFVDRLVALGTVRRLVDEERVCRLEEVPRHAWVVLRGALYYSNVAPSGAEMILGMVGPGSFVGLAVLADGLGMHSDIRARGRTELLQIPRGRLLAVLDEHPRLWKLVAAITAKRLRLMVEKYRALLHSRAESRIAWHLLSHARHLATSAGQRGALQLRMSQGDLAKIVGISRARLNGHLRALQSVRLVEIGYRSITLPHPDGLRRIVEARVLSV